jgi:signal transduction histidine kinase
MNTAMSTAVNTTITRVTIRDEQDVVHARQRARLIAEILGFGRNDQTRLSTAVSEIARNAYQYGNGGEAEFLVETSAPLAVFIIVVRDRGPGIKDLQAILEGRYVSGTGMGLGIVGTRRLLDRCDVETVPGHGTTVSLGMTLPPTAPAFTPAVLRRTSEALVAARAGSPFEELRAQNQELLAALDQLRQRDEELRRVNDELAETNRGMIALYTDLEQKHCDLEAVNQELAAFSYSVSHDLRAPLRAIDGFSHVLLSNYSSQLDDQGRHYLERVRSGTQRMAQLIDDLLSLSQITRGSLSRQRVDMTDVARNILAELERREAGRKVNCRVSDGLVVHTDPGLLSVMLENLLGNAWKFTSKQPLAKIEVGKDESGGPPVFFVRDNGAGFDMEHSKKLFIPFQRLHSDIQFEGTGIGLATVHRVVSRHGGRVWAEAQPGQGATFFFTLGEQS